MAHKYVKIEKFEELYPFEAIWLKYRDDVYGTLSASEPISFIMKLWIEGRLYKKVEASWWENIPEQGVLVWVDTGGTKWLRKVINHHLRDFSVQNMDEGVQQYHAVECENSYINVDKCTPLTDDEIKQFLRGE